MTHVCQTLKSLVKIFFQIPREVDLVESEIEGNFQISILECLAESFLKNKQKMMRQKIIEKLIKMMVNLTWRLVRSNRQLGETRAQQGFFDCVVELVPRGVKLLGAQ